MDSLYSLTGDLIGYLDFCAKHNQIPKQSEMETFSKRAIIHGVRGNFNYHYQFDASTTLGEFVDEFGKELDENEMIESVKNRLNVSERDTFLLDDTTAASSNISFH